ncbi:HlyD family secretion protein [Acidimangrovimonas sediminis]|uniref:HlyD family secretion protein n=1 Tax=Acidimangrovimonas sediminis TaxID=2056283 RepID=UPI000C7FCC90|nr:HlyD family secretion protein [Acidimangrovimonas sediminis]
MNAKSDVKMKDAAKIEAAQPQVKAPEPTPPAPRKKGRRRALMLSVPVVLVLAGGYVWLTGGQYEGTDNANLEQARFAVAATESGRVVKVGIAENEHVKKGELLFQIDPQPYRIAVEQAKAALAGAKLQVEMQRAGLAQARAQLKNATDSVTYYQTEYDRQKALAAKGVAATSSLDSAVHNLHSAQQTQAAAQQGVNQALAQLGGNADIKTVDHPAVMQAQAALDKAQYDLAQTSVYAPADGVIYKASSFKPGAYVSAGTSLFSLVETGDTWVEANFKETQLTYLKKGQKADVSFDAFPGRTFKATVTAVGAGTGAEFSLLPAQNATGNWVKVTQRVPVYLHLDDPDPNIGLRMGMSAYASVDTEHHRSLASIGRMIGLN